jgi:hypothetical protein
MKKNNLTKKSPDKQLSDKSHIQPSSLGYADATEDLMPDAGPHTSRNITLF